MCTGRFAHLACLLLLAGGLSACVIERQYGPSGPAASKFAEAYADAQLPDAPLTDSELREYSVTYNASAAAVGATAGASTGATNASAYMYGLTPVDGDATVAHFYYIRQDHYMRLVPPGTDPTVLETYRTFGPHPIGAEVSTRLGFNYYFIPMCGSIFASDKLVEIRANEPPPRFRLSCVR